MSIIFFLAVLCVPWRWKILSLSHQTYWLAVSILGAVAVLCLFGLIFFLAGHPTQTWFEKRLRSLPAHSLRDEAARIWALLCLNKKSVAQVICAAVLTQILLCLLFYLAGVSVGITAPLFVWPTFV